jgi:hypothetical protein
MEQTPVEFIVEQLDCLNRERKENLIDVETYFKHKTALIKEAKARENSQRKADMLLAMKEANELRLAQEKQMDNL